MLSNPFFELYVGDRISSAEFVTVFSDFLVQYAGALFLPGNIVVTGVQGSGKSMLLSLLKPEVRIQYAKANAKFPVEDRLCRFVGAGINLAHSNAIDFGYRRISEDHNETSILFGDFVNYNIALDLLASVRTLWDAGEDIAAEVGVRFAETHQDALLARIRTDATWFGYLGECRKLQDLISRMKARVRCVPSLLAHERTGV